MMLNLQQFAPGNVIVWRERRSNITLKPTGILSVFLGKMKVVRMEDFQNI